MGTEEPHTTLSIMDIKKQALTSASHSDFTLEALRQIAPSAFTEVRGEHGELTHKVDFEALKELLGDNISNSNAEYFGFHWVGKQDAKRAAAEPTRKTLRPVLEDSVDWDNTQNLYIEGDNLEVLKLLQNSYMGKVKMIYIDPPYNTGKDFIYRDNFTMNQDEYARVASDVNAEGNRLRPNEKTHARYHSDWCSMLYSRLLVARSLLSQDGVIFISIDDNEVQHLRMICDEVFGASNFVAELIWKSKSGGANDSRFFAIDHEYILAYAKDVNRLSIDLDSNASVTTSYNYQDEKGLYALDRLDKQSLGYIESLDFPIIAPDGRIYRVYHKNPNQKVARWRWSKETVEKRFDELVFKNGYVYTKNYKTDGSIPRSLLVEDRFGRTRTGKTEFTSLFEGAYFSAPKPSKLICFLSSIASPPDSLILDFFSGSATTAHAVMQLNAEDGGKRKYICVQLPEKTPEGSEARKAGYNTICEIGKARIRKAGEDILGKLYSKQTEILSNFTRFAIGEDVDKDPKLWQYIEDEATREQAKQELKAINERIQNLDTGFRVLRVDTSNMKEVYFEASNLTRDNLLEHVDSIETGRKDLDLLFGCMVDLGMELSLPIRKETVGSSDLYIVNEGALVACFDAAIDLEAIDSIASIQPQHVLFRESCFATDADKLNIYEQFKQRCGWSTEESSRRIHII